MAQAPIFTEKIDVGVASTAQFNVIAYLEGPNKQYLRYIEEQAHCRVTISDPITTGFNSGDSGQITLILVADTREDLEKAKELANNLIETVHAQKDRVIEAKAKKRAKKRKNGSKAVNLPEQLLLAMKFYYPGEPAEPPPPGSTQDLKIHKREFPRIAKQQRWFKQ